MYDEINGIYSTLEFMGLFLGIAFLSMLDRIGTRKELLRSSINREVGFLFLVPAIMGIVHVLFGLQMFQVSQVLEHAYSNTWLLFLIFIVIYLRYYFVTVTLYAAIVISKQRD